MSSEVYITRFLALLEDDTTVKLSWAGTFNTVTLKYSTDKINYTTIVSNLSSTTTDYTISDLESNTLYYFTITPYTAAAAAGTTRTLYATTSYTAAVSALSAGSPSITSIPLSWSGAYYTAQIYYKKTADDDTMYVSVDAPAGASSYLVQNLTENTRYSFYIVPYDINDISGTASSVITAKTDYTASVSAFTVSPSALYVDASWAGYFSSMRMQRSSDNETFSTISYYKPTTAPASSGTYTYESLTPYTTYYFRAASYGTYYNRGGYMTVSAETLAGFTTAYIENEGDTYIDLSWNGRYTSFDIYISTDGGATYTLNSTIDTSGTYSYTVENLENKTTYYFYLMPYKYTEWGVSSDILVGTTDYLADVSATLGAPTKYTIPLYIYYEADTTTFFMYSTCKLRISTDAGANYTDISTITQIPTIDTSATPITYTFDELRPCFTYYLRATPYSYGTEGNTVDLSHSTLGNIVSTGVSVAGDSIVLAWTGYYKTTQVEYSTDNFASTDNTTTTVVSRDDTYADDTTEIIETTYTIPDITNTTTYYYRFTPINYNSDSGETTSTTLYNATISTIHLSDISTTAITFTVSGILEYFTIQSSTDNSTFTDISTVVGTTQPKITVSNTAATTKYYRAVPYSAAAAAGRNSDTVYNPTITNLAVSTTDAHNLTLTWSGTYAYAAIQYATSAATAATYTTITTAAADTTSQTISTSQISTLDASATTYYFRAIPYSYGSPTSNINTGISSTIYNATITDFSYTTITGTTAFSSIRINWRGTFASVKIYYDTSAAFPTGVRATSTANARTLTDLSSNTVYYVKVVPYNTAVASGVEYTAAHTTTRSLLTDLSFGQTVASSTSATIVLAWSNNYYNSMKIYNYDTAALIGTFAKTVNTATISSLSSNSTYTYYAKVYDASSNVETTANLTAYTKASTTELGFTATVSGTAVVFSWTNSGYTSIQLQNTTTASTAATFTSSEGTTTYTTTESLSNNTDYTYTITVYNPAGTGSTFTKSITTAANITDASFSPVAQITTAQLPVSYAGAYSGVYMRVVDDATGTIVGNTLVSGSTSPATYTITNLSKSNGAYTVGIYPVNSAGVVASSTFAITAYTLSKITDISAVTVDSSSIRVVVEGSYNYVVIETSTASDFSGAAIATTRTATTSTTVDGLALPNTKYYFRATPVNQPTAAAGDMSGALSTTTAHATTWGILSKFTSSAAAQTAIPLTWDGSYNCTSVAVDSSAAAIVYGNITTVTHLWPNTTYVFRAQPINDVSSIGAALYTSKTTLPAAYGVYIANITSTGFDISINGAYSTYYLYDTSYNTPSDTQIYGNTVSLSGMTANSTYSVGTYVYNSDSAAVYTAFTDVATTLGTVSSAAVVDISLTYVTLAVYGEFTSYKIRYWKEGVEINTGYVAYGTNTTISDLSQNTTYEYVPFVNNKSAGAGTDVSGEGSYSFTTNSSAMDFSKSAVGVNSVSFSINSGSFTKLRVRTSTTSNMTTGLTYTVDISNSEISSVYGNTYTQSGLTENTQYYFTATTINSIGTESSTSSVLAVATLGNLYAVSLSDTSGITTTAIPVRWTGTYNTAMVEYALTTASTDYTTFATYTNSATPTYTSVTGNTFVSGLSPNTSYLFRITPSNSDGVAGTALILNDVSAMTLASVSKLVTATFDSSAVELVWDGSFDSVQIWSSDVSGSYTGTATTYTHPTKSTTFTGLKYGNTEYYFKIVAYNEMGAGAVIQDASAMTYPTATKFVATKFDSSAVSLTWDGSFDSVQIIASDISGTYTNITNTQTYYWPTRAATFAGLTYGNTTYYFKVVPTGAAGTGVAIIDASATTYPRATKFVATKFDSSAATLTWDGSFSSVNVYVSDVSGSYTGSATTYYYPTRATTFAGLTYGNTTYYFKVVPTGAAGTGIAIQDASATTYPRATKLIATSFDSSAATLTWDGSFSSVQIIASDISGTYTNITNTQTYYWPTKSAVFGGLTYGNTAYYFKIIPTGAAGTGVAIIDASARTYATVKSLTIATYDTSAVTLTWDGSYSYVNVYSTITAGTYSGSATRYDSPTKTTIYAGLEAGTVYYFKIVSVNSLGNGTSITDVASKYVAVIKTVQTTPYDSSAVQLTWTGTYESVQIWSSDVSGTSAYTGTATTYTYPTTTAIIQGLNYGNTKYYFKLLPYNSDSGYGTAWIDVSAVTYPRATKLIAAPFDSSAATVTWDGSFSSVQIIASDISGSYTGTNTQTYYWPTRTAIIDELTYGNTAYYFKIIPTGVAGTGTAIIDASAITHPIVKSMTATSFDSSAVTLTWDGSFNSTTIYTSTNSTTYANSTATPVAAAAKTTKITGLSANQIYYFKAVPINRVGVSGEPFYQNTITKPRILTFDISNSVSITTSSIPLKWSGDYNRATVEYTTGSTANPYVFAAQTDSSYTIISNLSVNTQYYFRITPLNIYNISGITVDLSAVNTITRPSVKSIQINAIYDTSAQITVEGSYNTIQIYTIPASLNKTYAAIHTAAGLATTGTDLSGLTPYTTYTIYATAYNSVGYAATASTTATLTTDPKLRSVGVTNPNTAAIDPSSIPISWAWTGGRGNVYIETTTSATYSWFNYSATVYDSVTENTRVTGLAANQQYYMRLTPFGATADSSGTSIMMTDTSAVTLARITDISYISWDVSAQLTIDGSYNYFVLSSTKLNKTYSTYVRGGINTGTDLSGLVANSLQTITITPYNSLNKTAASAVTTYTFYTRPTITKFYTSNYDTSAVTLTIDGSYNTATILWYASGGLYSFATTPYSKTVSYPVGTTIINGLTAQTKYYFRITPTGQSSLSGNWMDVSGFTMFDFSGIVVAGVGYGGNICIRPAMFEFIYSAIYYGVSGGSIVVI